MTKVMTNIELAARAKDAATKYRTLYIKGCFGAPMNERNKQRYSDNCAYNRRADRRNLIESAPADTFGFDCVCLIKGLLWGWCGNGTAIYGGAGYASNGVPDIGESAMIAKCDAVSTRFDLDTMIPGEMLYMPGHCGIYIGGGLAVECSPAWENKVQITACNCDIPGYHRRDWKKHGRLPWVEYQTNYRPTVMEWQKAAIADGFAFPKYGADGIWGSECESVAKRAIVKRRLFYTHKNLTKIVQKVVRVTVDGKCGKDTRAAIIAYQKANDLAADGEAGINTWKKMLGVK